MAFEAAITGSLVLENITVEEVLSGDWIPAYRITGDTRDDADTEKLVLLVDPNEFRILDLHMEGHFPRGGLEELDSKTFQLDIRFSDFDQPLNSNFFRRPCRRGPAT